MRNIFSINNYTKIILLFIVLHLPGPIFADGEIYGFKYEVIEAAIKARREAGYHIRFLRKIVETSAGPVDKRVIILGETHMMRAKSAKFAEKIIDECSNFGRERMGSLDGRQSSGSGGMLPLFALMFAGSKFILPLVALLPVYYFKSDELYRLPGKSRLSFSSPMDYANLVADSRGEATLNLEHGHRMGLKEMLYRESAVFLVIMPFVSIGSFCTFLLTQDWTAGLMAAGSFALSYKGVYKIISFLWPSQEPNAEERELIFQEEEAKYEKDMDHPLMKDRDVTMANNTVTYLQDFDEILDIVGQAHIPGMVKHLEAAGFEDIPFEEIEKEFNKITNQSVFDEEDILPV